MRRRLLLLACVAAPAAAQPADAPLELRITGGALPPAQHRIVVHQGDRLRWQVRSDAPGELHLHALRIAARVEPGEVARLEFVARASGRFPIEWHPHAAPAASPHAAPLAWLEVRPR